MESYNRNAFANSVKTLSLYSTNTFDRVNKRELSKADVWIRFSMKLKEN